MGRFEITNGRFAKMNRRFLMFDKMNTYHIKDRKIVCISQIHTFGIWGDANARCLEFKIARYADGTDLSQKDIYVCYQNASKSTDTGESKINTKDMACNQSVLSFNWVIPPELTSSPGEVLFYIEFRKMDEAFHKVYCLRTLPISETIIDTFQVFGTAVPADYTYENHFLTRNEERIEYKDLIDGDVPFIVKDREIHFNISKTIAVAKDNLSQILTFKIKRFEDGIDRSGMAFCFPFKNPEGESDISNSCNVCCSEDDIFIGWALDSKVTNQSGNVTFRLLILGTLEDGSSYKQSTKDCTFFVEPSVDVVGEMDIPSDSWYDSWLMQADTILKQSAKYNSDTKNHHNEISILKDMCEEKAIKAAESASILTDLYITREGKDEKGIFTVVKYYRIDDTLYLFSRLQKEGEFYTKRMEELYEPDGITLKSSSLWPITYDSDQIITGRFSNMNQFLYHGLFTIENTITKGV